MISVKILTSYPEMFPGSLKHSLIGRALKENIFTIDTINLHDFGIDNRKSVDVITERALMMSLLVEALE